MEQYLKIGDKVGYQNFASECHIPAIVTCIQDSDENELVRVSKNRLIDRSIIVSLRIVGTSSENWGYGYQIVTCEKMEKEV